MADSSYTCRGCGHSYSERSFLDRHLNRCEAWQAEQAKRDQEEEDLDVELQGLELFNTLPHSLQKYDMAAFCRAIIRLTR